MRWPRKRDEQPDVDEAMRGIRWCAEHAVGQVAQQGCCCRPDAVMMGWAAAPDGSPAPLLALQHQSWCPYLRAREGERAKPTVRCVRIEPDEGAS